VILAVVVLFPLGCAVLHGALAPWRFRRLVFGLLLAHLVLILVASASQGIGFGASVALDSFGRYALIVADLTLMAALATVGEGKTAGDVVPIGLAALTVVALSMVASQNFVLACLGLGTAAIILSFTIVSAPSSAVSVHTGQTYVVWMLIATVLLLFASSLDRLYARQALPGVVEPAAVFVVLGFAIVLGAFPFSLWLPSVCEEAPASAAIVVGLLSCSAIALLLGTDGFGPLLPRHLSSRSTLAAGAALLAVGSQVLALGDKSPRRSLAFLIAASSDVVVAALASGAADELATTIWMLGCHALAGALALSCLAVVAPPDDAGATADVAGLSGLVWRRPFLGVALVISVGGLIGAPLTAGFAGRLLVGAAEASLPVVPLALAGAGILGGMAALRTFAPIFGPTDVPSQPIRVVDVVAFSVALLLVLGGAFSRAIP